MSVASMQAQKFYEQIVADRRVFTFCAEGDFLVYPVGKTEVVPFWSSLSRMTKIQERLVKYRSYKIDEISFQDFCDNTLAQLEAEGIFVGVNWSGVRLTGYNLSVSDLKKNLDYWIAKEKAAEPDRGGS